MYGRVYNSSINYKNYMGYQDQIWYWVLGFIVEEGQKFCNPLRIDNSPGAWLEWKGDYLRLQDYADSNYHNMNCFTAVMNKFSCSFYNAVRLIHNYLDIEDLEEYKPVDFKRKSKTKSRADLKVVPRRFNKKDAKFWQPLTISSDNLIQDKVHANSFIQINYHVLVADNLSYTLNFDTRRKVYQPFSERKWISNTTNSDIWGIKDLKESDILFITKSYKDWRIIKNFGFECIAIQNEGMFIPDDVLILLSKMYKNIYVFYDNDKAGIKASNKIANYANNLISNDIFKPTNLPVHLLDYKFDHYFNQKPMVGITDISDFLPVFGKKSTLYQLEELIY